MVAPTSRARAFCSASQLNWKKDRGGPYCKKASVSAHAALLPDVGRASVARRAILENSFSFRARGAPVIGLRSERQEEGSRNLRLVIILAPTSRARAFCRFGQKLQCPRARRSPSHFQQKPAQCRICNAQLKSGCLAIGGFCLDKTDRAL